MYKMESYCLKCKKKTENIDPEISCTSNGRAMILSNCAICGSKKPRFIKNQEAKDKININFIIIYKNKFMPEMHLKQPGFTYSACGTFTKSKERIEKFMQTRNKNFIYKNKLDKSCFQHDMAYGKTKDLVKRTQSDKVLKDKAIKIASDPKYDGYQRGLASIVYKFFDKKSASFNKSKGSVISNKPNYQLANELHKPTINKF